VMHINVWWRRLRTAPTSCGSKDRLHPRRQQAAAGTQRPRARKPTLWRCSIN